MKRAYQIDERRAIEKFRSHLLNDEGAIQMILPLAEIAQRLRNGVGQFLLPSQLQLLTLIMENEVDGMSGSRYERGAPKEIRRWGHEGGSVVVNGQKVPVQRPRARGPEGDVKIGSYELLLRDGVEVKQQHLVTALGIDETGRKTILGFHQGASENQAAGDGLLSDLADRGLNFRQFHLNIIDGSKALRAGVRKYCGEASPLL